MYRLRSIYNLLDGYHELENQEIYFAPSGDLNDPMEGLLDVFWDGDKIVWENLLKHFLMCLEHVFALNSISGETIDIKATQVPVFKNRLTFRTESAKNIHIQIEDHFFSYNYVKKLPVGLAGRNNAIRRDELITHLRLVHAYAIQAIIVIYQQHGLLRGNSVNQNFTDLENFTKVNSSFLEMLNHVENEFSGDGDFASIFFSITGKVSTELNLLTAFHNTSLSANSNSFFLHYEFPEIYVSKIEEMVYPEWYTACFMTNCSNSSVWGHYGEKHKGVCLKFKTETFEDKFQLNVERSNGYNSCGPTVGMMPHKFYKINYENKHVEIDFLNL